MLRFSRHAIPFDEDIAGKKQPLPGFLFCLFLLLLCPVDTHAQALPSAERALMDGRIDAATAELQAMLASQPSNALAHLLLCRAFYAIANADGAIAQCTAALNDGGGANSEAQDWMGRAFGMKAEHASALVGFSLARKVRSAFERAVQLDPRNAPAVDDLAEYYISAPGIVGGGTDKALVLAGREQAVLPQSAHRTRALVAEKTGDFATAEREFRAATAVANRADAWFDLGHFLSRRKQTDAALDALRHAVDTDTSKDAVLVDIASVLSSLHREPQMAEKLLQAYLASNAKSDAAPAFEVHYQLGQLLAANGDKAAAAREFQQSMSMASAFVPAHSALSSLNEGRR